MPAIEWDESLKVNIPAIDQQHKRLIELISDLERGVSDGTGGLMISYVFQELIRYVAEHFKDEEELMLRCNFPALASHRKEHDYYVQKLGELQQATKDGDALSIAALAFMKEWILTHIKVTDQEYASIIKTDKVD